MTARIPGEHYHAEPCLRSKAKAFARRAWPWVVSAGGLGLLVFIVVAG